MKHTNYPCRKCITEGKATDFMMFTFDSKKMFKKMNQGEIIRYGFEALENSATGV